MSKSYFPGLFPRPIGRGEKDAESEINGPELTAVNE